jgi:hypothetical protein
MRHLIGFKELFMGVNGRIAAVVLAMLGVGASLAAPPSVATSPATSPSRTPETMPAGSATAPTVPPLLLFWVGVGFAAVTLVFLMVEIRRKRERQAQPLEFRLMRLIGSLCAAFSGTALTGSALFSLQTPLPGGGVIAFQAAAGCALFGAVWFTFGPEPAPPAPVDPSFTQDIPAGWTLQQALAVAAEFQQTQLVYEQLTDAERLAPIQPGTVRAPTLEGLLEGIIARARLPAPARRLNVRRQTNPYERIVIGVAP